MLENTMVYTYEIFVKTFVTIIGQLVNLLYKAFACDDVSETLVYDGL